MYQSVASITIPLLDEALDLPLFTHHTNASAKARDINSVPVPGNEVEDLFELLPDMKRNIPGIEAVCASVLWSDYQPIRKENAASRIRLVSFAPLWHRNQSELLNEMIVAGVNAIIIKVAGIGLNNSHLGCSLAEMQRTLEKLNDMYNLAVVYVEKLENLKPSFFL